MIGLNEIVALSKILIKRRSMTKRDRFIDATWETAYHIILTVNIVYAHIS